MSITQNKTLNQKEEDKKEEKIKEIEDTLKRIGIEYKRYSNEIVIKGIITKSVLSKYPELIVKRKSTIFMITILDIIVIYVEDTEKKIGKQITLPPNVMIVYEYPNLRILF